MKKFQVIGCSIMLAAILLAQYFAPHDLKDYADQSARIELSMQEMSNVEDQSGGYSMVEDSDAKSLSADSKEGEVALALIKDISYHSTLRNISYHLFNSATMGRDEKAIILNLYDADDTILCQMYLGDSGIASVKTFDRNTDDIVKVGYFGRRSELVNSIIECFK